MRKKKDFFSGWTAMLIVLFGVFVFIFLVQLVVDNFSTSSGGSESASKSFSSSSMKSFQDEDKPIGTANKEYAKDKKLSEITENISKSTNLSDEEKVAMVEQKMAEGAQAVTEGDFQAALKTYNELVEFNPQDAVAINNRGDVYQEMKNYTRAIEDYDEAIQINSDFAIAYCSRGASYIKIGNYEQAIKDLNKAIELQPDYAEAYKNLSICYRAMGDNDTAQFYFDVANSIGGR